MSMRSVLGIGRSLLSKCYPVVSSNLFAFPLDVVLTEDFKGIIQVKGVSGIGIAGVCYGYKLSLYHIGSSFLFYTIIVHTKYTQVKRKSREG